MVLSRKSVSVLVALLVFNFVFSFIEKEFLYKRINREVTGTLIVSKEITSNVRCAAMCLSFDTCFAFNVLTTRKNGVKICNLIDEITKVTSNPNSTMYMDVAGYHVYHQYVYWRGFWLKMTTEKMNYTDAVTYCAERKLEMFIPRDQEDNDMMYDVMIGGGISYMWYPVNDIEEEGIMKWLNDSVVAPNDSAPWRYGQYGISGFNPDSDDCAQLTPFRDIVMYPCYLVDAGVVCKSNLDELLHL